MFGRGSAIALQINSGMCVVFVSLQQTLDTFYLRLAMLFGGGISMITKPVGYMVVPTSLSPQTAPGLFHATGQPSRSEPPIPERFWPNFMRPVIISTAAVSPPTAGL